MQYLSLLSDVFFIIVKLFYLNFKKKSFIFTLCHILSYLA